MHDLKPDVLGITESWTNMNVLDSELGLEGYQLFRCDRSTGNRGGGVLLYVKSSLAPTEFHTKSQYGEHVWCSIGDLLVGVCYRSTNLVVVGDDNEAKLHHLLQEVSKKHMLLIGDFNHPDIDWKSHSVNPPAPPDSVKCLRTVSLLNMSQLPRVVILYLI